MYEQYIRVSEEVLSLTELTSVLVKMAVFCSYFMEWDDMGAMVKQGDDMTRVARFGEEPRRVACLNIVMPYTDEEECWISEQVSESIAKIRLQSYKTFYTLGLCKINSLNCCLNDKGKCNPANMLG